MYLHKVIKDAPLGIAVVVHLGSASYLYRTALKKKGKE
ncbi:hypothetical protein GPUN_1979 [Glaciecola punicea ACAM 611]|jgi:hypothetical protein|uniref:Uncharacterized protein n=1 Tax=Glaciecola punicea ACAM 611 TaxID=1121923 RepID=H5TCR7_9ALTE|nr:hypothetical protein GPUN_1979 [Glaciecola punicea ACAM 611]